jgi:hypothetical protein
MIGLRTGRPQQERRFGLVEFSRDPSHQRLSERIGVRHESERVAGQRLVGEHVDDVELGLSTDRSHQNPSFLPAATRRLPQRRTSVSRFDRTIE